VNLRPRDYPMTLFTFSVVVICLLVVWTASRRPDPDPMVIGLNLLAAGANFFILMHRVMRLTRENDGRKGS
jgi:hypothetical protein